MSKNPVTLDQAATLCRSFGHSWSPVNGDVKANLKNWAAIRIRVGKQAWDIMVQCDRCTTKRIDIISASGELAKRKYIYPQGYQRSRIPRPELRLELKTVLKVWGSEEEMEMW